MVKEKVDKTIFVSWERWLLLKICFMIDFMINRELQSENDLEKYQKRLN